MEVGFKPGELVKTKAGKKLRNRGDVKLSVHLVLLHLVHLPHQALHFHHVDELEPANPALTLAQPGARRVLQEKIIF